MNTLRKGGLWAYCNTLLWVIPAFFLLPTTDCLAEGTKQLAPNSTDMVMLMTNRAEFGDFASYDGPESSRLYITIKDVSEIVYLGLSREYSSEGVPQFLGAYNFRIKRAGDGAVVHGPFSINSAYANVQSWEAVASGPHALTGEGYETTDARFLFEPDAPGDYYIEFDEVVYIGHWDITVGKNGVEVPGRIWSKNWAFRTPVDEMEMPECLWSRKFNGQLFSYTADGFVTKIDFSDSGFQGLSFNVAFNESGPGTSGNFALDRQSVEGVNLTDNIAQHKIFLQEPDINCFPNGDCGGVTDIGNFECTSAGYCLPIIASRVGVAEIILDFNSNGVFDADSEDVTLVHNFEEGELNACIAWDGLKGNGEAVAFGDVVDLVVRYAQGVQHWAVYDGEYLKSGFCVESIRPLCGNAIDTDRLYWDDRNLSMEPGTGQPKDGRSGCSCEDDCRSWDNFNINVENCNSISDDLTTGYGDRNTLNTWWYANVLIYEQANIPILNIALDAPALVCENSPTAIQLLTPDGFQLASVTWFGPNGQMNDGNPQNLEMIVTQSGTYTVVVVDEEGCEVTASTTLNPTDCDVDIELDKSVDNMSPFPGETITYSISVTNAGTDPATGILIFDSAPSVFSDITFGATVGLTANINANSNQIEINIPEIDGGQTITFEYTVVVPDPDFNFLNGCYQNVAAVVAMNETDIDSTPLNEVDTDGDGDISDDPEDEDDADGVIVCPANCNISTEVSNIECLNNGTPSDPSDDQFTFSLTVFRDGPQSTWTADDPAQTSGAYGTPVSFGPYPIAGGAVSIDIFDEDPDYCNTTVTIQAPATCSDLCTIDAVVTNVVCLDNGTPSDASDDLFEFGVLVFGENTSNGWSTSGGMSGNYGQVLGFGPYPINDGTVTLQIEDSADSDCVTTLNIDPPATCSDLCSISAVLESVACDDNDTPSDATDDVFFVSVVVDGFNLGSGWTAEGFSGNYGDSVTLGPFVISAGLVDLVFVDNSDADCTTFLTVVPPATCSNLCDIEAEVTTVFCDDNGTASMDEDDVFFFDVTVSGLNLGGFWQASNGAEGAYFDNFTFGPYSIADGTVQVDFQDAMDPNCQTSISVEAPGTCSDDCQIEATIVSVECDNNGTPSNPDDDVFYVDILAEGFNLGNSWSSNTGQTGVYGETFTFGPFAESEGSVTIILTDQDDPVCSVEIVATSPGTCSNECYLVATVGDLRCEDNGTPNIGSDDFYVLEVTVDGSNLGSGWIASNGQTGAYGELTELGNLTVIDGFFEVEIQDADDAQCTTTVLVEAPAFEIECPQDTSSIVRAKTGLWLDGALEIADDQWSGLDTFCWLSPLELPEGLRYVDTIQIRTSDTLTSGTPYTFVLYSEMTATNVPVTYPADFVDGLGAIFKGHIDALDPCCTIMRGDRQNAAVPFASPIFTQHPALSGDAVAVWTTSVALEPGETYVLQVSSWLPATVGDYGWLIYRESDGNAALNVITENVNWQLTNIELEYDLLCDNYPMLLDNISWTGRANLPNSCGSNGLAFEDEWLPDACFGGTIARTFSATNSSGQITQCNQQIDFRTPTFEDVNWPSWTYVLHCYEAYEEDANGQPHPLLTGYPFINTAFGYQNLNDAYCNLSASYQDTVVSECGLEREIERTWMVLDECVPEDTLRMVQRLKVKGDRPVIACPLSNHYCPILEEDIMLWSVDAFSTTANLEIPWPEVYGGCQDEWDILTEVFRNVGNDLVLLATLLPTDDRLLTDLEIGDYTIRYRIMDGCEAVEPRDCIIRITDLVEPVAICFTPSNFSIGNLGVRRLYVHQVNNNSYDNTEIATIEIRRKYMIDPESCEALNTPTFSAWGDYVVMECCDVGTYVTVELRVTDIYGNVNICWTDILVEDKTLPTCLGIPDQEVACSELPDDFDPYNTLELQDLFGLPEAFDNCIPQVIELDPEVNFDECSSGTIIRRFYAVDSYGNQSQTVVQVVTISGQRNYEIRFPEDATINCEEEVNYPEIYTDEIGCELLAVTHSDELSPNANGCYQIARTYHVINWCEYDGTADPVVVSRDEDCDGVQGEEAVWVLRRTLESYIDRDSLASNAVPFAGEKGLACDGNTNVEGYWRTVQPTGFWQYTQLLNVIDNKPPEIALVGADTICVDSLGCDAFVEFGLNITDGCLADSIVSMTISLDAFSDGIVDAAIEDIGVISGSYPDYELSFNYIVGAHRLVVSAEDLCGNVQTRIFPFVIEACYSIIPECQGGLANYEIHFPADTTLNCYSEDYESDLRIWQLGCGDLEVEVRDTILEGDAEVCMRVARTFMIKNNCVYDGISDPVVISRDENCDGEAGAEAVWLLRKAHLARTDADSLGFNAFPLAGTRGDGCDGQTNPEGYWRDLTANGYWSYTQIISVVDETEPEIQVTVPQDSLCADIESCVALWEASISLVDMCWMGFSDASFEAWMDTYSDGTLDKNLMAAGLIQGNFPDYTISGEFEIGTHEIILFAADACGNEANISFLITILDCGVEAIICEQDMAFAFERVVPLSDVDEDGSLDQGMVEVFATDLLAEEIVDCSGEVVYSINIVGDMPDINQQSLLFTCNDTLSWVVEIYAWDMSYNPNAVQPDGTIGGPNYSYCITSFDLIDPNGACKPVEDNSTDGTGIIDSGEGGIVVNPIIGNNSFRNVNLSDHPQLFDNSPNPFRESTVLSFYLPEAQQVQLQIFTATGKELWALSGYYDAGLHQINITNQELAESGLLFYCLRSGTFFATKKMIMSE